MIMSWLDEIIGTLPSYIPSGSSQYYAEYYSIVKYMIAGVVLIFMLTCFYRVLIALFGRWVR